MAAPVALRHRDDHPGFGAAIDTAPPADAAPFAPAPDAPMAVPPTATLAARRPARLGLLLAFLAYASWGLLSPVGKWLLDHDAYGPLGLNAVRFAIATVLVWAFLSKSDRRDAWRLMGRRDVLGFNLLANVSLTLFLYSLVLLPPAYATLGFYTAPLWTALWAWIRLGERVGHWFLPAAIVLLAGGYLTLFGVAGPPSSDAVAGVSRLGLALAVGSGLVWAFYTVALRRGAAAVGLRPLMGASFALGAVYFIGLAVAFEGVPDMAHQSAEAWGWMALYVAVPTLASFILFNAALQRAGAGSVNLLVGAELAFTVLFSYLFFGAHYTRDQMLGLALVLVSVTAYLWVRSVDPRPESDATPR